MDLLIKNIKEIGSKIARIHNQPLTDLDNGTRLDGQYLITRSRFNGMPFHAEIQESLAKTDKIIQQIIDNTTIPFVNLWNNSKESEDGVLGNNFYGNPAWDLGIIVHALNDSEKNEFFIKHYLDNKGVLVTIAELYTGILHAKLNDAISNRCTGMWGRLAENECADFINGKKMCFRELNSESLARLGLPGLTRV